MLGVILCGGQSSRMGADKGLIIQQSATWAEQAADKMATLQFPVVLSVNKEQCTGYAAVMKTFRLVEDNPAIAVKGPLLGVLSVHHQFPGEDLFVLACDMLLMEVSMLHQLYINYQHRAAEVYGFADDSVFEPLCSIYTSGGLAQIMQLAETNQLKKFSMKYLLEKLTGFMLPPEPSQKRFFRNFNSPADLNGL